MFGALHLDKDRTANTEFSDPFRPIVTKQRQFPYSAEVLKSHYTHWRSLLCKALTHIGNDTAKDHHITLCQLCAVCIEAQF